MAIFEKGDLVLTTSTNYIWIHEYQNQLALVLSLIKDKVTVKFIFNGVEESYRDYPNPLIKQFIKIGKISENNKLLRLVL